MSARESVWLEHRRRRYMRPDADRYWRADAARFMTPNAERQLLPQSLLRAEPQSRKQTGAVDEAKHQRDYEIELAKVKSEFAALRFQLALVKLARAERKANFNPDQPRDDRGRWSYTGSLSDISGARRGRGHHYVVRELYEKLPLPQETRQVFEEKTTGPLGDKRSNKYDLSHRAYNKAVKEHFERFLENNKIDVRKMAPDQARRFLKEIWESADPRIRSFNMRILLREILIRGPLRSRGIE